VSDLRSRIIRMAHTNPELRPHLLPLVSERVAGRYRPHPRITVPQDESELERGIKNAIKWATSDANRNWDPDPVSVDGVLVSGAYKSTLPRDGGVGVPKSKYDRMVRDEIKAFRSTLDPLLKPYMDGVQGVDVYPGDKGWVHVVVTMNAARG